jgi:hypothetical protein
MKQIKTLGGWTLAAIVLVAIVVPAAASAALPEVGRCVKVAKGTGAYKGSSCVTHATGAGGSWEFIPVTAAEKQAFAGSGSSPIITTAGHGVLTCVTGNMSGEWTGPKTATVQLELQACTNSANQGCQTTPAQPTEIRGVVEAEIGFIKSEAPGISVGFDLKPQPPLTSLATYECGNLGELNKIEGSVIAKDIPLNKMVTTSALVYKVSKATGQQVPESFEGGVKDTLSTTFMSGLESSTGESSLKMTEYVNTNVNPLEIKAKEL